MKHVGYRHGSAMDKIRPSSPSPAPSEPHATSNNVGLSAGWKSRQNQFTKPVATPMTLQEKLREQPPALQPPEVETDNWDDDFEEGISFSKLQGALEGFGPASLAKSSITALEKTAGEDEKPEGDWNAQTIRPITRTPSSSSMDLAAQKRAMSPVIEDYSDLAGEDDEAHLMEKVADLKVIQYLHLLRRGR
jgi:hypothetical protein